MNSIPSDFILFKGKVIHQNDDNDLPVVGKFPDHVHVYLWLVLYPEGVLASWDRNKIDFACFDMIEKGIFHEFFSHVVVMSFETFKLKFPNVPLSDQDSQSEHKYTFKKH